MGKTSISWTNFSWNPWFGCHKVSQGCRSCYAEREMKRFGRDFGSVARAKGFDKPLKWKDPAMVFTCSWSDFFIEEADPWRDEAWEIIRQTPHLTYQILTKRPENIKDRLPGQWDWGAGWDNVWLGVSVELQEHINRAGRLAFIPAKKRFISAEPLLGFVNIHYILKTERIDWVIVGGESGPNFRSMDLKWVRYLRDQCRNQEVAFFMKQLGGHPDRREDIDQFPEDLRIQEFPVVIL